MAAQSESYVGRPVVGGVAVDQRRPRYDLEVTDACGQRGLDTPGRQRSDREIEGEQTGAGEGAWDMNQSDLRAQRCGALIAAAWSARPVAVQRSGDGRQLDTPVEVSGAPGRGVGDWRAAGADGSGEVRVRGPAEHAALVAHLHPVRTLLQHFHPGATFEDVEN